MILRAKHAVKHAVLPEHYGRVLKHLRSITSDKCTKEIDVTIYEVRFRLMSLEILLLKYKCNDLQIDEKLGWVHAADFQKNAVFVKHPPAYRLFLIWFGAVFVCKFIRCFFANNQLKSFEVWFVKFCIKRRRFWLYLFSGFMFIELRLMLGNFP